MSRNLMKIISFIWGVCDLGSPASSANNNWRTKAKSGSSVQWYCLCTHTLLIAQFQMRVSTSAVAAALLSVLTAPSCSAFLTPRSLTPSSCSSSRKQSHHYFLPRSGKWQLHQSTINGEAPDAADTSDMMLLRVIPMMKLQHQSQNSN